MRTISPRIQFLITAHVIRLSPRHFHLESFIICYCFQTRPRVPLPSSLGRGPTLILLGISTHFWLELVSCAGAVDIFMSHLGTFHPHKYYSCSRSLFGVVLLQPHPPATHPQSLAFTAIRQPDTPQDCWAFKSGETRKVRYCCRRNMWGKYQGIHQISKRQLHGCVPLPLHKHWQ